MISVIIPTLNPDKRFAACLSALVPAVVQGLVHEVIVVDGGSDSDLVTEFCDASGAKLIRSERGRGAQMAAGAKAAKGKWLLFLHADTVLEGGWEQEASLFIERVETGEHPDRAGAFQFALDDFGFMPRLLETFVGMRCIFFKLPYGDQGLLISSKLYKDAGGFREIPLMEDVDIIRRLGWSRLLMMRHKAITSAKRFKTSGYVLRMGRNLFCLFLFYLRVPPRYIERIYG